MNLGKTSPDRGTDWCTDEFRNNLDFFVITLFCTRRYAHNSSCTCVSFIIIFLKFASLHHYPLPPAAPPSLRRQTSLSCPTLSPSRLRWKGGWNDGIKHGRGTRGQFLYIRKGCVSLEGSRRVRLPLYFHRPPPPPLAEIYKEQKIRRGREEEGGWYTPRLKSRGESRERGVFCTRDFPPLSTPKGGGKVAILETKRNEFLTAWKRLQLWILYIFLFRKNMAENVLDSGPPSAKRPKLSSPALSASTSDGNGKSCLMILGVTM